MNILGPQGGEDLKREQLKPGKLSDADLKAIESFDEQVLQIVRKDVRCHPEHIYDGQWIIKQCKQRSIEMGMELPNFLKPDWSSVNHQHTAMLQKHGLSSCAKKAHENGHRAKTTARSTWVPIERKTYSRVEASAEIDKILNNEEEFLKNINLFGQKTAEMIRDKAVEHVLNNTIGE